MVEYGSRKGARKMEELQSERIIIGVLGMAIRRDRRILLTRRHAPGQDLWHDK